MQIHTCTLKTLQFYQMKQKKKKKSLQIFKMSEKTFRELSTETNIMELKRKKPTAVLGAHTQIAVKQLQVL